MALARVRREQGQHLGVVRAAVAGQGVADDAGQMEIAYRHQVGCADGPLQSFGGRPGADARDELEPRGGRLLVHRDGLLHAAGHPHRAHDRVRALGVDAGAVPLPGRDHRPRPGVRHDVHALGGPARRGLAEPAHQEPPGAVRLDRGDLLLEDGGDQGLQDEAGTGQAQARAGTVRLRDEAVAGFEGLRVVQLTQHRGELVQHPLRALAPRLGVRGVPGGGHAEGGGAGGGA